MNHANSGLGIRKANLFRDRSPAFQHSSLALRLGSFSLLELIGVLAAIALLSTALAPALVRQMDRIASDQESAALKSFSHALQQSIRRNRSVPSHTNWVSTVALELGAEAANVATNGRQQPRLFLIDPAWQIGTKVAGETYTQTSAGSAGPPVSPRLLLVSSIGRVLPASLTNSVAKSNNFNASWD